MFWPIILPLKITFCTLALAVFAVTLFAQSLKWKRGKAFLVSSLLAIVGFIPSCTGIQLVADAFRFGHFEYATFDDINDFRAERYLPNTASNITMYKYGNGYHAQYTISELDFHAYLDKLWEQYGDLSVVKRGAEPPDGTPASEKDLVSVSSGLELRPSKNAVKYISPREPDGGGATYYFDREVGVVFQRTGYW